MKKKKGFTLVELLAVIAVLAIILVIAVPKIMNVIEDAREGTLLATAKIIAREAEKKLEEYKIKGIEDNIYCEDIGHISNSEYQSCDIKFDDNGVAKVTIKGKGKYAGMNVCNATRYNGEVTDMCYTDSACFAYGNSNKVENFDIDETACKEYISDWGLTSEQQTIYCTGGTFIGYFDTLIDYINNEWETVSNLEGEGVISNVVYDASNKVTSLDINESACRTYVEAWGMTEEGVESFCTGGPEGYKYNLKDDINAGHSSADYLAYLGVISNIVYDGIEITGYDISCGGYDVSVPKKIDNMTVVGIGIGAFSGYRPANPVSNNKKEYSIISLKNNLYNKNVIPLSSKPVIRSITLPDTIEYIGDYAFRWEGLTSLDLSNLNKLKLIGEGAFQGTGLTSLKLPSSLVGIGDAAFYDNDISRLDVSNLTNLVFIGQSAFEENPLSGALNFSNSKKLQEIYKYAFAYTDITSVTLPSSVYYIGYGAFYAFDLTSVTLGNVNAEIDKCAFGFVSNLTSHNLPETYVCDMK